VRYDATSHQFVPFLGGLSATELDFSRDGNWVTYVADPGRTLWRSRVDGSDRLQLTSSPVSALLPRWSPDGTQIAFVDEHAGPFWKIYLIPAQGGAPEAMLPQKQNQMDPSWSPDGKQLAFGRVPWRLSTQEKIAIQIFDLASHRVSTIPDSENLFAPRWSPDGRHLAAVSRDNKELMLFDFRSQKWTTWVNEPGAVSYPTWSRNGRYLYYDNTSVNRPGYHRVQIGQSRSEFLIDLKPLHQPIPSEMGPWANIAPDGSGVFERDLSTSQIYALDVELP